MVLETYSRETDYPRQCYQNHCLVNLRHSGYKLIMNTTQLHQKIASQLNNLSPERLALVSEFLDSLEATEPPQASPLRKLPPLKRGKTAKDLLKFAGTWQGDDMEECLDSVYETRSETQF
ncbi:hypothetical protein [Limnospira sp. PMC 289.06]|uniref:hypothetical protein n=1 Tax=Limnospira sp. PMC 289.06 TaxID=2981094 RepID=UPI0028E0E7D4|nr:hypothetical protein [Limnospira sp. PMC 289.06]